MVLAELIGVFVVALSILYVYYKFVIFNFWRKRGVFYIKPVVPIGNITALVTGKKQIGVFFHDVYMKYKDHRAIGMYLLYKPNLVIADLDLIRTVLTKEFASFHDRGMYCNEKIDPLSGHLFLLRGKKWRNLRVKMTPTFTSGKIKQMFLILKECGEDLTKYLESNARIKDSIEIEMKDMFARLCVFIKDKKPASWSKENLLFASENVNNKKIIIWNASKIYAESDDNFCVMCKGHFYDKRGLNVTGSRMAL